MSSTSLTSYLEASLEASLITAQAKTRKLQQKPKRILYHSALTSHVAAWDFYINSIVRGFYQDREIRKFTSPISGLMRTNYESKLRKFNTPNAENTRNLLLETIGYDPWQHWSWTRKSRPQVTERLNEILKVRHSFSHGFTMPQYTWNTTPRGETRINGKSIDYCKNFLDRLARLTDNGLQVHKENIIHEFSQITQTTLY